MFKFFRLTLLRSVERFLADWLLVSTEPSTFVRERVRLGDAANFVKAASFFLFAISSAFLAEVATVYLLGIGGLTESYYWLFILLTSIPFVLVSFLLVRLVAPLSLKDVLHLSFHPVGAGIFAGAVFALIASAVVALLFAVGWIPEIKYDFAQWGDAGQMLAVNKRVLHDCLKQESLVYTVLSAGLQAAYLDLKPPIDGISWLRPIIAVLYLIIAAVVFMAAVDRRKPVVFGLVLLAALVATGANYLALKAYFDWNYKHSDCLDKDKLEALSLDRVAESVLKEFARGLAGAGNSEMWDASIRAEGRALLFTHRFKNPIVDMDAFNRGASVEQKAMLDMYCSNDFLKILKPPLTETIYGSQGERLTSFSMGPADCPQW